MLWMLPLIALAQEPSTAPEPTESLDFEQAKRLYSNGARLYEEAQYEQSILAFKEAYALTKEHDLLYNIASAQERMGDLEASIKTLNTFRIYADETEQDSLSRKLRTLEKRLDDQRAKERSALAAPVPVPVPVAPRAIVAPAPTRNNPLKPVLIGTGGAILAVFGASTIATFIVGSGADTKGSYDTARVINLTSGSLALVGAGISGVGFALPAKKKPTVAVAITPRQARITTHWQF